MQSIDNELIRLTAANSDANYPAPLLAVTLRDAFEGFFILGSTGSGKTSGSGRAIATALVGHGMGGLVLTAKSSDLADWQQYMPAAGRARKILVIKPGDCDLFNFLDYERADFERKGNPATTLPLVTLLLAGVSKNTRASKEDPYWEDALRALCTNAVDTVSLAKGQVLLEDLLRVVQSAPQSRDEVADPTWRRSPDNWCFRFLDMAQAKTLTGARRADLELARDYWLNEFAGLTPRVRSIITSSLTSKLGPLVRSPMREMFCGKTNVDIPRLAREGTVVLLDIPVKTFGEVGRVAQVLIKTAFQRAVERSPDQSRPVFLWEDEAQNFVSPEDSSFQQTARSAGCVRVCLTQSITNFHVAMGGDNPAAAVDSFVGNLNTKIFHASGDHATNEWAQKLFGESLSRLHGHSVGSEGANWSVSQHREPNLPGSELLALERGCGPSGRITAYVFRLGSRAVKQHGGVTLVAPRPLKVVFTR